MCKQLWHGMLDLIVLHCVNACGLSNEWANSLFNQSSSSCVTNEDVVGPLFKSHEICHVSNPNLPSLLLNEGRTIISNLWNVNCMY